jgi:hypothetical protein
MQKEARVCGEGGRRQLCAVPRHKCGEGGTCLPHASSHALKNAYSSHSKPGVTQKHGVLCHTLN